MALREDLLRESKALASNLEDIKKVSGDTDLLRQTGRVLALAVKCVSIMGKNLPGVAYNPPKSKVVGRTLYSRDRQTTAETSIGYVGAFEGERNIDSSSAKFIPKTTQKIMSVLNADRWNNTHHLDQPEARSRQQS